MLSGFVLAIDFQYPLLPKLKVAGVSWSLSQLSQGGGWLTPWTGRQVIAAAT